MIDRLHASGLNVVQHHPAASEEIAKQQGYVVAKVEEWAEAKYPGTVALLAAAPELLAACKQAIDFADQAIMGGEPVRDNGEVMRDIRAAVAKAEGRT